MRTQVTPGTSLEEIVKAATNADAKYIVVRYDAYKYNYDLMYFLIEDFNKLPFFWHEEPEDRGAKMVYYTDQDIPAAIEEKQRLLNLIKSNKYYYSQIENELRKNLIRINLRWGKNNPKRIEAEENNAKVLDEIARVYEQVQKDNDNIRILLSNYKHV